MSGSKTAFKSLQEMPDKMVISVDDYVKRFTERFTAGVAAIAEAARTYAEAFMRHPSTADAAFRKAYPNVRTETWEALKRIGNGDLVPDALLLPAKVREKLTAIPIAKQERMFNGGVFKAVTPGTLKTVEVGLASMTVAQADVVFDMKKGVVRSEEEQMRLLKHTQRKPKVGIEASIPDYEIVGATVRIRGVTLGIGEVRHILAQMERLH